MAEAFEFRLFRRTFRDGWFFVRFLRSFHLLACPYTGTNHACTRSLCRFATLILLRRRKQLLPFGSSCRIGSTARMVGVLSRSSKPFSARAETFLGMPKYSLHCQHIGIRLAPNP